MCSCASMEGRVPCRGRAWETTLPACPVQGVARTTPGVGVCGGIVCAVRMGVNFRAADPGWFCRGFSPRCVFVFYLPHTPSPEAPEL